MKVGDLVEVKPNEIVPYAVLGRIKEMARQVNSRYAVVEVQCISFPLIRVPEQNLVLVAGDEHETIVSDR